MPTPRTRTAWSRSRWRRDRVPRLLDRGSRGETAALTGDFALVLLDLTLPGKDGLEVLSVARDGREVPLTAREFEVLVYLRSGPDRNGPQRRVPAARPSPLGPAPGKPAD